MGTIKNALSNTFYLISDWFTIMIFGYIFWIMLAKLIQPSDVGMFSTISNIAIFMTAFTTFGFNNSIVKIVPQYLYKKMDGYAAGVIGFIVKRTALMCVISSAVLLIILGRLVRQDLGTYEVAAVIIYMSAHSIYTISQGVLAAFQNMKKIFITDMFNYTTKILLSIFLISLGFNYFGPVIAFAFASVLTYFWRMRKVKIESMKVDEKEILDASVPAMIGNLGMLLFFQSTIIILGFFTSAAQIGIYTISFMLTTPLRAVFQSISGSIAPITSGSWAGGHKENVEELTRQSIRYSIFLIAPALLIFLFFSDDILTIFTRGEYLAGTDSMKLISAASVLFGLSYILSTVLYSIGEVKKSRNLNITGGVVNSLLCIFLIPSMGIFGAAFSFALASLSSFLLSIASFRGKLNFNATKYLLKILVASTLFYIVIFSSKIFFTGILSILFAAVAGTFTYFSFLFYSRFFEANDVKVLEIIDSKIPQVKIITDIVRSSLKKG